jgi:cyclopropane-fatty-acyl-phospholipid synthase
MYQDIQQSVEDILAAADIKINGGNPWDMQVHNKGFFRRAITEGSLGIGESYMEGWWDAEMVDETIFRILRAHLEEKVRNNLEIKIRLLIPEIFNLQSRNRAFIVGEKHYDLGNDLFRIMLDKEMNYSCGYWKDAKSLEEAQESKLELICRKLYLKPGMQLLDIGCGWGAFSKYAAEKYHAEVTGITVSREQMDLASKNCAGLPVRFLFQDYRDLKGSFDRIVSIGMIEHVGYMNYKRYFEVARDCLKEDGLFLLQTIGRKVSAAALDPWTQKYIFPNGMLPSVAQLGKAMEHLFFVEDLHNFGADYDRTLMAWFKNFDAGWPQISQRYPDPFYRMWKYYLLSSAGSFRARENQLWQMVLAKEGILRGYTPVR